VPQYDYAYFEKQFEGLPPRAMDVVALRAALRVLPVLAYRRGDAAGPFAYWQEADRRGHGLATLRCYQASAFVNSLTKADIAAASYDAAYAAYAARAAANAAYAAARAADSAANAARAAASAAANAAYAAARAAASASAAANAARAAASAAYDAAAEANAAEANAAEANAAATIQADIKRLKSFKPSLLSRAFGREIPHQEIVAALEAPLWPEAPQQFLALWRQLQSDLRFLDAGFELWIDWYQDRLDGKPFKWELERQWALLSKEQLAQSPAEINAYLKALRDGALTKQLRRVRAIFIGHGEVGKTSLIRALHGEDVIAGQEAMTQGVAIQDAIHEQAGVFTRVTDYKDDDLTVHFWDFGGQVMAHATHQFFLRSKCLYVIVLAGRAERNPNEEAEYWLEHVRAFGDSAPVLLVGNKVDVAPVNLDQKTLADKYKNIVGFYSLSCTQAKGAYRARFEVFREEFKARLAALGEQAERFTPEKFNALKAIEGKAAKDDFLPETGFDEICRANGIAMEGAGGRDGLLDLFDKLGIVMHFARLPFLTDYVLNPRWLTYGVYSIMYSEEAKAAKGRLSDADLVAILRKANPSIPNGHAFRYPPDRCQIIANAMIAFQVAYRLGTGQLVVPALLASDQPDHDFRPEDALAFRFDFGGFLPRHVLPALIVEHFQDIARVKGAEVVWQNGVLLRPKRLEAQAFVRADYHMRTIDFHIKGGDGPLYLGMLRESVLATLETMPQLPYEEKVELRRGMRFNATDLSGENSVWMSYGSILGAQKRNRITIDGPDGKEYILYRILAAMPADPAERQADVFLSYSSKDGAQIEKLDGDLGARHYSVWWDRGLIAGQSYRDVLQQRIETVKAVVVLWTENSIGSKWVRAEADLADKHDKLICLRDPKLDPQRIPMPFAANHHIIVAADDLSGLLKALALKGAKPRI
jgi:hypothetical protein